MEAKAAALDDKQSTHLKRSYRQSMRQRWRPMRRRIVVDKVSDDVSSAPDAAQSAECLRAFWSPVVARKPACMESMRRCCPFIQSAENTPLHICEVEEVLAIILATNNSAPGPDGVPYAAFRASIDLSADIIFECYGKALEGDDLPADMEETLMILDPERRRRTWTDGPSW